MFIEITPRRGWLLVLVLVLVLEVGVGVGWGGSCNLYREPGIRVEGKKTVHISPSPLNLRQPPGGASERSSPSPFRLFPLWPSLSSRSRWNNGQNQRCRAKRLPSGSEHNSSASRATARPHRRSSKSRSDTAASGEENWFPPPPL